MKKTIFFYQQKLTLLPYKLKNLFKKFSVFLAFLKIQREIDNDDAEKLVLPNYQLAGSSLSRKHGLVTFVYKRQRYMLLNQSPPTLEIEWLCVDVVAIK